MSDYSSSGSSSGDDSDGQPCPQQATAAAPSRAEQRAGGRVDRSSEQLLERELTSCCLSCSPPEELFDVCLPSVYPYRPPRVDADPQATGCKYQVNPERMPALETTPPGAYHPRGTDSLADTFLWDPTRLTPESLAPFLLYARRVHSALSMAELLDLVRQCNYNLQAAEFAIIQPLAQTTPKLPEQKEAEIQEEVRDTLARLYAHRHVKRTAAAAAAAEGLFASRADPAAVISTVSKTNQAAEEAAWNDRITRAKEAITSMLNALLASNKKFDLAYVNGLPSTTTGAGPGRKPKAPRPSPVKKVKAPSSDSDASDEDDDDEGGVKSEAEVSEAEDVPMVETISKQPQQLDASFVYPWLQVAGFATRTPAPSLIDLSRLREYIGVIEDNENSSTPLTTPELTIQRNALLALPRSQLDFLSSLYEAKSDWLTRARPILNAISRGKDNQTLEGVLELLRDLEQQSPCVDSKERRKCINLVTRAQEWRVRAQVAFTQASIKANLHNQGLLQYGAAIHSRHAAASPATAAAASGRASSPAAAAGSASAGVMSLPLSAAPAGSVPFTVSMLNSMVKECERCCGQLQTEESVFLRSVTDFACNFARQVDTLLACRLEPAAIQAAKDEVEGKTAAAASSPTVKKEEEKESKEDSTAAVDGDENGSDDDDSASVASDAPRRRGRAPKVAASPAAVVEAGLSNEYPQDHSGALPAKMSLAHARNLLVSFARRFALHFRIYQTALLRNEIQRTEMWVRDAEAILSRSRRPETESLAAWLAQLSSLLATSEALAIAVEPTQADPLVKGLRSRIWAAKVDSAFEVKEDETTPAEGQMKMEVDDEEKTSSSVVKSARRGPTLQSVYDLLEEAVGIPITPTSPRYVKLEGLIAQSQSLIDESTTLFGLKGSAKPPVRQWQALLDRIRLLPVRLEEEGRIERVIANTHEWHRKATAMLQAAQSPLDPNRRAPHAISFQEIESLLHRTSHGKAIALVSDTCADPRDNSAVFTELSTYLRIGRSWCEEVALCFKNLSAVGSKKAAAHTVPGSGSNVKKSSAAGAPHDGLDRYATMERLKQLLGLYTSRDAEIPADESDDEDDERDEKKDEEKSQAEVKTDAAAAATPASDQPAVAAAPPSLPSTDPASWTWLARYSISPDSFELLLPQLHLKMADSLSERLNLVSECLAMAWSAIRGPKKNTIVQLHKLVNQLQQSGELPTSEPLRTLSARLQVATRWRTACRAALPEIWLNDIKKKQRRRLGRESGALLAGGLGAINMRGGRRTRKKSATPIQSNPDEAGEDESEGEHEEEMARESSLDVFRFSDDEDEAHAPEEDQAGEDGESMKSYKCTLAELQELNSVFERFAAYRQHHPETGPATFATPAATSRPTTPNTSSASPETVQSVEEPENLTLGLDLVDLDERDALQKCIDECLAWQTKARATLAQPACAALADRLAQVQPMFTQPKLAAPVATPVEVPAASLLLQQPIPGEEECIASMKSVLAEFEDEEVFVPEMQQLSHLTWAKDWIYQAHHVLAQCAAAAASLTAAGDATEEKQDEAVAAATAEVTGAAPPSTADGDVIMTDAPVAAAAPVSAAAAVAPASSSTTLGAPVPLDSLVSLLRILRSHFGSSRYTPLLFHMQFLRQKMRRGGGAAHAKEESEAEEEKEEDEQEQDGEEEKDEGDEKEETKEESKDAADVKDAPMAAAPAAAAAAVAVAVSAEPSAAASVVKMETDEPMADAAAAPAAASTEDVPAEADDDMLDHDESKEEVELDPFLETFRHDIQHIEAYVHDVLSFSHRVRQLFERRLGLVHTNLLLGPQREELLLWLADAADEAGVNATAVGAPASMTTDATAAAPHTVGSGLLATCRRVRAAKQKGQKAAAPTSTKGAGRGRGKAQSASAAATAADASNSAEAAPANASSPARKPQRVPRARKEHTAAEDEYVVEDPAMQVRKRREKKSSKAAAASAGAAVGVKEESLSLTDLSLDAGGDDDAAAADGDDRTLHCLCQRPYVEGEVMISCDACTLWFHAACLNLSKLDLKRLEESKFLCPACAKAARKPFRYRDKLPNRKAKVRLGPKLATLEALLAKAPKEARCEEVERAKGILAQARQWTEKVEAMMANPPTEQWQPPPPPPSIQAPVTESDGAAAAATNGDSEMADAAAPAAVTIAPPPTPPAAAVVTASVVEPLHGTRRAGQPGAPTPSPPAVAVASPHGQPTRKDVETMLKAECAQRELWLKTRQVYTDSLSDELRGGMGLPLELPGRKALEERIRLLIHLEKAERILLDNVTVPLLPSTGHADDEADIAAATAALAEKDEEKENAAPGAPGNVPAIAPSAREREQTPLTPHAKRHEYREIGLVHQELEKLKAANYQEPVANQNLAWTRLDAFYQRLQAWIEKTNLALYKSTASTLHALLLLQTEYKNHFLQVISPTFADLQKRLGNIVKWIPREKKALAKKYRASQLWKLQLERVSDCGLSTSPYTIKIQAECTRIEEWDKKLHWGMESKSGPQHFKALLKEATEGEHPVLVDPKDITLCQGFTELCQWRRDKHCFGEDSRVLTDRGFLFIHELESLVDAGASIQYASYDRLTQRLTYCTGKVIYPPTTDGQLLSFTSSEEAQRWTEQAGDYGASEKDQMSDYVSLRVTADHTMYVQRCATEGIPPPSSYVGGAEAMPAREVKATGAGVRFLAHAPSGFQPSVSAEAKFISALAQLGVVGEAQIDAFCQVYGCWLGNGSLSHSASGRCTGVLFGESQSGDFDWLKQQLATLGVANTQSRGETSLQITDSRWCEFFDAEYGTESDKWFLPLVWTGLSASRMGMVLGGVRRASRSIASESSPCAIFTSSIRFREELIRACYHAGFTATFRRAGDLSDSWLVQYCDATSSSGQQQCWPTLPTSRIEPTPYTGRVWGVTVDHPDHLIFAHRAHLDGKGVVTKASRTIVVGNCLCQVHYQDGVFMIACDGCEDWFHDSCVNLTQKVAEKIKKFLCPRCCQKDGIPYKYGPVQLTPLRDHAPAGSASRESHPPSAPHATTATAIPATTVQQALVPSHYAGHPQHAHSQASWQQQQQQHGMDAAGHGMVWQGHAMGQGMTQHQMMIAQQQQQQQQQQQAAAQAKASNKRKKAGATAADTTTAGKKKRAASAIGPHDSDSDGGAAGARKKKPKVRYESLPVGPDSTAPTAHALHEATLAASAAGVVGPMSLAVLQHEPLMGVPVDAPPPRTAALYATLLYENLHVQVSAENANVLWHLLNGYMNRMFDSRLEEEILEAAKLVAGEQLLTDALAVVNTMYTAQVQLQWRQQQHQQAQMIAIQNARHAPRMQAPPPPPQAEAASDSDDESDGQGGKKPGKRKPKNFPRPPLSAYKCFVRHLKSTPAPNTSASSSGKEVTLLHNMQTLADAQNKSLNKLMSEKWRQLGKDQRAIFEEECVQEKEKYDAAVHAWNEAKEAEALAAPQTAQQVGHDGDVEMEAAPGVSPQAPLKASSVHESAAVHSMYGQHRPVHAAGVAQAIPSAAIVHTANVVHHPHHHHPMMASYGAYTNPAYYYSLQQQHHAQMQQQQVAQVAASQAIPAAVAASVPAVSAQEPTPSASPQAEVVHQSMQQGP